MTFPVNIAVVGCGAWGRNYVRNLQGLPEAELSWLCDLNPGSLRGARGLAPDARCTDDLALVLADPRVQAVVVATNTERHYDHVMRALAAGKHVLVEKPMATAVRSARAMLSAARSSDRVLMVGHLMVYHPATRALRTLVRSGALGSIQHIYALRVNLPRQREGVGPLWSLAPHDLSLIQDVLGQQARRVRVQPDHLGQVGLINLQFSDQLSAQIQLSLVVPRKERTLVVAGSERVAIFDDTRREGKLMVFETRRQASWPWDPGIGLSLNRDHDLQLNPRGTIQWSIRESTGVAQQIGEQEPLALQCRHFLSCVAQGRRPRSGGQEGLDVVRLLAAAERSLHRGGAAINPEQLDGELNTIQAVSPRVQEETR